MPTPNGFDYFRRGQPFRNVRGTKGYSLDYFRRGQPLRPIAPETVTTESIPMINFNGGFADHTGGIHG